MHHGRQISCFKALTLPLKERQNRLRRRAAVGDLFPPLDLVITSRYLVAVVAGIRLPGRSLVTGVQSIVAPSTVINVISPPRQVPSRGPGVVVAVPPRWRSRSGSTISQDRFSSSTGVIGPHRRERRALASSELTNEGKDSRWFRELDFFSAMMMMRLLAVGSLASVAGLLMMPPLHRKRALRRRATEDFELEERRSIVTERGGRLDQVLALEFDDMSRSRWGESIAKGKVLVNKREQRRKSVIVEPGDEIQVTVDAENWDYLRRAPIPEDLPLEVIFEDDDIVVVNKAPGMVTHPAPGRRNGTLANALAYRYREFFQQQTDCRTGIVHRLDKGTSGVIVAAKNIQAQTALAGFFRDRKVQKLYLAVCAGKVEKEGVIETYIARHPTKRDRMTSYDYDRKKALAFGDDDADDDPLFDPPASPSIVTSEDNPILVGKPRYSKSTVRTLASDDRNSVVQIDIATGRTHQIRVHLAELQAPVLGDDLYGDPRINKLTAKPPYKAQRPLLHAWQLKFPHPARPKEILSFTAPPPDDIQRAIKLISNL